MITIHITQQYELGKSARRLFYPNVFQNSVQQQIPNTGNHRTYRPFNAQNSGKLNRHTYDQIIA